MSDLLMEVRVQLLKSHLKEKLKMPNPIESRSRSQIVNRRKTISGTVRELSCGHEQEEVSGGRAKLATEAVCKTCSAKKVLGHPTGFAHVPGLEPHNPETF